MVVFLPMLMLMQGCINREVLAAKEVRKGGIIGRKPHLSSLMDMKGLMT